MFDQLAKLSEILLKLPWENAELRHENNEFLPERDKESVGEEDLAFVEVEFVGILQESSHWEDVLLCFLHGLSANHKRRVSEGGKESVSN